MNCSRGGSWSGQEDVLSVRMMGRCRLIHGSKGEPGAGGSWETVRGEAQWKGACTAFSNGGMREERGTRRGRGGEDGKDTPSTSGDGVGAEERRQLQGPSPGNREG
mmetsp:Transcript_36825/g.87495  ORF Transcript_36825/g.87495 Transcript_36825/m.87495 type:complete len:106 (+) Transcript_36825:253-570(+)